MWVTQAGGAPWLQATGLALDATALSSSTTACRPSPIPAVFAAGDIAAMQNYPLEKAGVFAVRQGRPLADNLRRSVQGAALAALPPAEPLAGADQHRRPLRRGVTRGLGFAGAWVWRWKDWIDRRFMRRFSQFEAMPARTAGVHQRRQVASWRSVQTSSSRPSRPSPCAAVAVVPRWAPPCFRVRWRSCRWCSAMTC